MPYIDAKQLAELEASFDTESSVPEISWSSHGRSHAGRVRRVNEDAYLSSNEQKLWAVADGMGGLSRGDYASKVVVEALLHFVEQSTLPSSIIDLEIRLRGAHGICRNTFRGERVGSTVAAMYIRKNYAFFLWAGDSRIYRLRDGKLESMTSDHTVAQEKIASGEWTPGRAALDPSAHVLTRAVGVHQTLHLDLHYDRVQPGERYLICSDGLYNDLSEEEIQERLARESAEDALDRLLDRALDKGGRDNITAIVCDAFVPAG